MPLRIIVTEAPPEVMLTLEGELDIAAVPDLRAAVHQELERDAGALLIDLAGVTFLDSAGLWGLIFCRNLVDASPCTFAVTGRSAAVDRLLRILDQDWVAKFLWPDHVHD